jgi:hypothetical protein
VCSVHPAALVFPEMSPADLDELVEDIKQNGLVHRVVYTSDGVVLDGRNRLKACEIAGIDPQFEVYAGSNPVGFIISANLRRRQLNESQRALIATRLATLARGQHQTTFESDERPNDQMRKFADSDSGMTQAPAAAALNVSKRSVQSARVVLDHGTPELIKAVEQGRLPVSTAARTAKPPKTRPASQQKRNQINQINNRHQFNQISVPPRPEVSGSWQCEQFTQVPWRTSAGCRAGPQMTGTADRDRETFVSRLSPAICIKLCRPATVLPLRGSRRSMRQRPA